MEHLGVADQAVDVRFGEEIRARGDEEHVRTLHIEREAHVGAGLLLHVLFQAVERVAQRRRHPGAAVVQLYPGGRWLRVVERRERPAHGDVVGA